MKILRSLIDVTACCGFGGLFSDTHCKGHSKTYDENTWGMYGPTCLIVFRETSNYHRCGRTDKGVSAFGQVSIVQ